MSWQYTATSYRGGYSRLVPLLLTVKATRLTVPEISCHLVPWQQLIVFEFSLEMVLEIIHQCTNEMLFQRILIRHLSHYIFRSKMQKEAEI